MSIRTTLFLAMIVALLGAVYVFRDNVKAPEDTSEHPKLVSISADDVVKIDLTTGGTALTLEKKDGLWLVTSPYKGLASTKSVKALVNQLTGMQADRVVNEGSTAGVLKQYGLDKPQLTLTLHAKDGKTSDTVAFGLRAPSESGWYARVNGKGSVLLGGNAIAADILRAAPGWRESGPLPIDTTNIDRLAAKGDGVDLEVSKEKDKESWVMARPRASKADGMAITTWLTRLQSVSVDKFFDTMSPTDPNLKATYTLQIWNKDQRDPMTLTIGAKTTGGWYAMRSAAGTHDVFLLPDDKRAMVGIEPSELADKHLFPDFDMAKAARAEVHEAAAGDAAAEKATDSGQWSFSKPAAMKDELGKVPALLYTLKDLKYEHRVTDPKELAAARASLVSPKARFTVADDKGAALATLVVGGETPSMRRWVQTTGPDIYTADASFANDWKANIEAVKNSASPVGAPSGAPSASTGP